MFQPALNWFRLGTMILAAFLGLASAWMLSVQFIRPTLPRAPLREHAADDLQIDQRVAALDRARRAAIQIVPSPVKQASQLEIAVV
jgi:hypothetical protein